MLTADHSFATLSTGCVAAEPAQRAEKATTLPRAPKPVERFPFSGSIWTAASQHPIGSGRGLFYRGHEPGSWWRGEFRFSELKNGPVHMGDTVLLRRDGHNDTDLVVMNAASGSFWFRCCAEGSPI
jgi:hypothetical protein